MVKLMLRRGMLATLAAAFVTAGVAYATSTSGGIDACAKTTNGQLRLDTGDGCLASEQQVTLGAAHTARADERYYAAPRILGGTTAFALPVGLFPGVLATATPVITTHVPAGNYVVTGEVTAVNFSGSGTLVCLFRDSADVTHGYASTQLGNGAGYSSVQTITMDGALVVPEDTDLRLICWSQNVGGPVGQPEVWAAAITTKTVDVATITQETH